MHFTLIFILFYPNSDPFYSNFDHILPYRFFFVYNWSETFLGWFSTTLRVLPPSLASELFMGNYFATPWHRKTQVKGRGRRRRKAPKSELQSNNIRQTFLDKGKKGQKNTKKWFIARVVGKRELHNWFLWDIFNFPTFQQKLFWKWNKERGEKNRLDVVFVKSFRSSQPSTIFVERIVCNIPKLTKVRWS